MKSAAPQPPPSLPPPWALLLSPTNLSLTARALVFHALAVTVHTLASSATLRLGVAVYGADSAAVRPLWDAAHAWLPHTQRFRLAPEVGHLLPVLALAWSVLAALDQRAVDALRVFLWAHGCLLLTRAACFSATLLPDASQSCHTSLFIGSCHDLLFSGHVCIMLLASLVLVDFFPQPPALVHGLLWPLNLGVSALVVTSRNHYSIDVLVAALATGGVYVAFTRVPALAALAVSDPLHVLLRDAALQRAMAAAVATSGGGGGLVHGEGAAAAPWAVRPTERCDCSGYAAAPAALAAAAPLPPPRSGAPALPTPPSQWQQQPSQQQQQQPPEQRARVRPAMLDDTGASGGCVCCDGCAHQHHVSQCAHAAHQQQQQQCVPCSCRSAAGSCRVATSSCARLHWCGEGAWPPLGHAPPPLQLPLCGCCAPAWAGGGGGCGAGGARPLSAPPLMRAHSSGCGCCWQLQPQLQPVRGCCALDRSSCTGVPGAQKRACGGGCGSSGGGCGGVDDSIAMPPACAAARTWPPVALRHGCWSPVHSGGGGGAQCGGVADGVATAAADVDDVPPAPARAPPLRSPPGGSAGSGCGSRDGDTTDEPGERAASELEPPGGPPDGAGGSSAPWRPSGLNAT